MTQDEAIRRFVRAALLLAAFTTAATAGRKAAEAYLREGRSCPLCGKTHHTDRLARWFEADRKRIEALSELRYLWTMLDQGEKEHLAVVGITEPEQ